MSIKFNNTAIEIIKFNGTTLDKILYNGTLVYESGGTKQENYAPNYGVVLTSDIDMGSLAPSGNIWCDLSLDSVVSKKIKKINWVDVVFSNNTTVRLIEGQNWTTTSSAYKVYAITQDHNNNNIYKLYSRRLAEIGIVNKTFIQWSYNTSSMLLHYSGSSITDVKNNTKQNLETNTRHVQSLVINYDY